MRTLRLLALPLALFACLGARAEEPAASPHASAPQASAPAPAASSKKTAAELLRGAQERGSFLPLWSRGDQSILQVPRGLLGAPLRVCLEIATSGAAGWAGHYPAGCSEASFEITSGGSLRLVAVDRRSVGGDPERDRSVSDSYPRSQIASAPALNSDAADGALADASSFLLSDWAGLASAFEARLKAPYSFDPRGSQILWTEQNARSALFALEAHLALPKLPASALPAAAASRLPDPRSALARLLLRIERFPDEPMPARSADPRVGYFAELSESLSDKESLDGLSRAIRRWRLEKADPASALSRPKRPIVFWIDPSVPKDYRRAAREGILSWNQAFAAAGFLDPLVVVEAPSDSRRWLLEARAVLRWNSSPDPFAPAIGPTVADERTGEILLAAVNIPDSFTRLGRERFLAESPNAHALSDPHPESCSFAAESALEMEIASASLPQDPAARERFAQAYLQSIVAHEVGHALGLRHNGKASLAYSPEQLRDEAFVSRFGVASSHMDYLPHLLLRDGSPSPSGFQLRPGPYDRWAIEFGYSQHPPELEPSALESILSRSESDPLLSFSTDEDFRSPLSGDPDAQLFDLSSDPLGFYAERLELSRALWLRLESGSLPNVRVRRALEANYRFLSALSPILAKSLSGIRRDRLSPLSSRPALRPVSRAEQERAFSILERLFDPALLSLSPGLLARAASDPFDLSSSAYFDLPAKALQAQSAPLRIAFSRPFAERMLLSESFLLGSERPLEYLQVHERLSSLIWPSLSAPIPSQARALQREHALLLASAVSAPSASLPADAQASLSLLARGLAARLREASSRISPRESSQKAHLENCLAILDRALRSEAPRSGV